MTAEYKIVLATDLDGTFLEGSSELKCYVYTEMTRLRDRVMLIYTTGRPIESVKELCSHGLLPYPHFVIGDHGTHIVDGVNFNTIDVLQNPIIKKWGNGNILIKDLLQDEVGIQLQPMDPPYRVAYYYDPECMHEHTVHKVINAGYDVIQSCDMYLDIVPQGVNKGSSLIKLLNHLGIDSEIVVTCGDSLNDLSLFSVGLKSIVVGNSESKLLELTKDFKNVYHSKNSGLSGVIEGLRWFIDLSRGR